jgi:hypothetical protein
MGGRNIALFPGWRTIQVSEQLLSGLGVKKLEFDSSVADIDRRDWHGSQSRTMDGVRRHLLPWNRRGIQRNDVDDGDANANDVICGGTGEGKSVGENRCG